MQARNWKFYLLAGAFFVCAVLAGIFRAVRTGPTDLEQLKVDLRARGERLTLSELLPDTPRTNRVRGRMDDVVRIGKALDAENAHIGKLELQHHIGNGMAEPAWTRTNLIIWTGGASPVTTIEWSELESGLMAKGATLAEAQALAAVPDACAGQSAKPSEYHSEVVTMARWLGAVHAWRLKQRKPAEAMAAHRSLLQLVAWHAEELTMDFQNNRIFIGTTGLKMTWSTLQDTSAPAAPLEELLAGWKQVNLVTNLPRVLEVERATGQKYFQLARNGGVSALHGESEKIADAFLRVASGEADELFCLRQTHALLGMSRTALASRSFATVQKGLATQDIETRAAFESLSGMIRLQVSNFALPRSKNERTFRRFFKFETWREMTVAALALELHRRKHERHPDLLGQLVPEFLPAVPMDWMDGKPLRYRLNPDGTYLLWSVGEDLKDDKGDPTEAGAFTGPRAKDIWDGRDAVWPRLPQ